MFKLKSFIKHKIRTLLSAFFYLAERAKPEKTENHTIKLLWENSRKDSAQFIQNNIGHAMIFEERPDIRSYSYNKSQKEGLLLEFGVFKGVSINFFANLMTEATDQRIFYGFDSFEGIEEDWAGHFQKKHGYSVNKKLPPVKGNVKLIAGWVEDTVIPFLKEHKDEPIAFVHIDTDTYTPCKFLLETLHHRFKQGTIILFDELHSYPGWKHGELKALDEFSHDHPEVKFNYIAFARNQATIIITDTEHE